MTASWEKSEYSGETKYYCSNCGGEVDTDDIEMCLHCKIKMDV